MKMWPAENKKKGTGKSDKEKVTFENQEEKEKEGVD